MIGDALDIKIAAHRAGFIEAWKAAKDNQTTWDMGSCKPDPKPRKNKRMTKEEYNLARKIR